MNRRWYDEHEETPKTLELLQKLDQRTINSLSKDLSTIVKQIKELRMEAKKNVEEDEDEEISLGLQRVLGLYQSENGRRWYDKKPAVNFAMRSTCCLGMLLVKAIGYSFLNKRKMAFAIIFFAVGSPSYDNF